MNYDDLIAHLKRRANDPKQATDMLKDVQQSEGNPVMGVANPAASLGQVQQVEKALGFSLPALLRRLYLEVGGGRFGPGYGLLSLADDNVAFYKDLYKHYAWLCEQEAWNPTWLPFCYFGCDIYSVLDVQHGRVGLVFTDAVVDIEVLGIQPEALIIWQKNTLEDWLNAWLTGEDLSRIEDTETVD